MKTQLRIIIALIFYLNVILTIELFRRGIGKIHAEIKPYEATIMKIDIVKVAGKWLAYGNGLPMEK